MLGNIPYSARIAILIAFAAAVILYDSLRRRGNTDRQWEYGLLFVAGALGAFYGALSNAIVASITPDYFRLGNKFTTDTQLIFSAIKFGAYAGFSAGAIACAIWHYALYRIPPPRRCHAILRLLWIPFVAAGIFACFMPVVFGSVNPFQFTNRPLTGISPAEAVCYELMDK